jgi:hypothetical protein
VGKCQITGSTLDEKRTQNHVFCSGDVWFTVSTSENSQNTRHRIPKIPMQFLYTTKVGFWFAVPPPTKVGFWFAVPPPKPKSLYFLEKQIWLQ